MQRATVFLITSGLLLGTAGAALADGDEGAPAAPAGDGSAAPATAPAGGAEAGGGGKLDAYIERPGVLGNHELAIYGDFDVANISITDPTTGASASSTAEGLQLGAAYGVSDKLTAGIDYSFTLHPGEIKGPLRLYGSFSAVHTDKLTAALGGGVVIDFSDPTTETIFLGALARYNIMPKLAIFTGTPTSAPGPSGQHLQIGLNSGAPITLDIPVGVGLQATPQLWAYVDTTVAHISISNSANAFLFSDFIPLEVGGLFAVSKQLDVGAHLQFFDLKGSASDLAFGVSAVYYMAGK